MTAAIEKRISDDEISLGDLVQTVRKAKWRVLTLTIAMTVSAGVAVFQVPKTYKAHVIVAPVSSTGGAGQMGALSSMVSQFGGLASLAGISGTVDNKKAEAVAVLQSETLTQQFIEQNQLLPVLYRDKWDAGLKRWKETDPTRIPTLWTANQYFGDKIRTVDSDTKTGMVTLTIAWNDPAVAANWANGLIKLTNDYLRQAAIEETERNISYLNGEAARTSVLEVRQAIYTILQTEIDKEMLARGSQEYALKVIDRAFPPERPASPRKVLWLLSGAVIGLILSVLSAFMRTSSRQ
jgi:uncharacterized protein involved in exopolysaccharide biosynthesis